MILLDVNVLLYASIDEFPQHVRARDWLDAQMSENTSVGFPWVTLVGYLRVATNRRLFTPPIEMSTAWGRVQRWLAADCAWVPQATARHQEILGNLLSDASVHGNLVPDAHLAALAIEHGLTLCSTDGDFARWRQLKWINPIAA